MIVLDNSALVDATTAENTPSEMLKVLVGNEIHVPHLIDYEFRNALRGLILGGKLTQARAEGALIVKDSLPFIRYSEDVTGPRAWDLRHNLDPYDASYVALAEQLQCPLVTTDAEIERHVRTVEIKRY